MTLTPHTISFSRLADMVEGRLDEAERAVVEAHVATCRRCTEQVARLERTIGLMRADTSEDAPRDVLSQAISLFGARRPVEEKESFVRKVLAALSFDSADLKPAFGVRSAQAEGQRQMLFSAGEADVDLRLARVGEGWVFSGQVLGECVAGGRVHVESLTGGAGAQSALNDLCEFTLPPVPEDSYRLRLLLGDAEIEVPEINLTS